MQAVAQKIIRTIPARKDPFSKLELNSLRRRRVAGYGRVSTDSDEQLTSYEAQIDYYTNYIKSKPEWEFVRVYADEGITGTNTKNRNEFNEMIDDALDGKIDLIITKSVARFARNTVDTLTTVRKLKEKGIEIFFETEGIYTLDSKGELLLTIMSSVAQEESRKISENVRWGNGKRMQDGKFSLAYKSFLGYEKGENDTLKVNSKEAETVKLIYKLFLQGKSPSAIARILTSNKIPSPMKKEKWSQSTVQSILTNEKYRGDALLQKCYTVDFLSKKRKINDGEVPQYYIENSHEAIIDPEIFEAVQNELKVRQALELRNSTIYTFSSKLICGDCGSYFGSKLWHSNDKYRCRVWQCNQKFKNKVKCQTPHLKEEQIKNIFIEAFNKLMSDKSALISDCTTIINELYDTSEIDLKIEKLLIEKEKIEANVKKLVLKNATTILNQDDYNIEYNKFSEKFESLKQKISDLEKQKAVQATKLSQVETFLKKIDKTETFLDEFDEELWFSLVKNITVNANGTAVVVFKNGAEIKI